MKVNHECDHAINIGICKLCEFNDKPCSYQDDVLECAICKEEYKEDNK